MSETKPVETALAEAAPANPEPAVESAPATTGEIISTEATEGAKTEEKKEEAKEPPKPITEGAMGYKAPGLVKSFRFSKKFFWFGDEAVEVKDLQSYLRGEKPDVAYVTAAWSSQTGNGLLYFAKVAEGKSQPIGVINLSEVSDLTNDGTTEFYFKLHGHKHSFQTSSTSERDSWFETMKTKVAEAKELASVITGSEGYKEAFEKLGKSALAVPAVAGASSSPKKSTDKAPEGVKKDNASSSDEESKKKKVSRSVSRKRGSIFGFLGKKEEHEEKKDEKKEEKEEDKAVKTDEAAPEASAAAEPVAESAKAEESAPAAEEPAEPVAEAKETPPKLSKRNSIFASFRKEKKEAAGPTEEKKEATPEAPKDAEAPASEPVAIPAAESTEPATEEPATTPTLATSSSPKKDKVGDFIGKFLKKEHKHVEKKEEPAPKIDVPATETAPAAETETTTATAETTEPAATTETPAKERRRSFFGLGKKSEKKAGDVTSDSETEPKEKHTPTSPLEKLEKFGELLRKPSKAKAHKETKKEATPPATVEETAEPAATTEAVPAEPAVTNGAIGDVGPDAITVGQTSQPVQAAA